jgi:hypothetical protein
MQAGPPRASTLLGIVLTVAVAACAGGGGSSATPDSAAACHRDKTDSVETNREEIDYVAQDAGVGALSADIAENTVTLVFERSDSDANQTAAAYGAFGADDEHLDKRGSVVVVWDKSPTDEEKSVIDDCL